MSSNDIKGATVTDPIGDLLRFDALATAEALTGQSYKEGTESTMALGFALHLANNEAKRQALTASRDTHYSMKLPEALEVFRDLGFEEVLVDTFEGTCGEETYRVLWHNDGILATVESYSWGDHKDPSVNTSKIYYNVRFPDGVDRWPYTSSGSCRDDVWVGDHDAREGVRHSIEGLRTAGEFLPIWSSRPFLWLLTYADSKVEGYDYKAITAERISRLPQHVQDAIGEPE